VLVSFVSTLFLAAGGAVPFVALRRQPAGIVALLLLSSTE